MQATVKDRFVDIHYAIRGNKAKWNCLLSSASWHTLVFATQVLWAAILLPNYDDAEILIGHLAEVRKGFRATVPRQKPIPTINNRYTPLSCWIKSTTQEVVR